MTQPAMIHPPIASLTDGRPYDLLDVEEWRVVDGEPCVIGVWANHHGVTRALVRVAVVTIPEAGAS